MRIAFSGLFLSYISTNCVYIDGCPVPKSLLKRWSPSLIFCYERGCNCNGCLVKEMMKTNCRAKYSVRAMILVGKKLPAAIRKGIINDKRTK